MRPLIAASLIAAASVAAGPGAAQLPPAPEPVPGSLLDDSGPGRGDAARHEEREERRDARTGDDRAGEERDRPRKTKRLPDPPTWRAERPDWARADSRVIATFTGPDILRKNSSDVILRGTVATRSLQHPKLTWFSRVKPIPPQRQACATIYLKLHEDFRPGDGGKLPGFSNTGMGRPASAKPEVVNGRKYPNTGWGGRRPDGIHWSARSGFGGWDEDGVKFRTYFYAMAPRNLWGKADVVGRLPKGRWSAYVQCVKLNTPGVADGGLYYEVAGTDTRYARDDIRWRDLDVPETLIDELWLDFYCGGTKCGDGPRGTVSFAKAVVTRGLPDMGKVRAELARLDRTMP